MITFAHYGKIGDLLYSINFARELTQACNGDKFNFKIQTNVPFTPGKNEQQSCKGKKVFFTVEEAQFIKPLIEAQPYINQVLIDDNVLSSQFDLSLFRHQRINYFAGDIRDWYYQLTPNFLPRDFYSQIIFANKNTTYKDKIIITLSQRYVNQFVDYKQLEQFKDHLIFLGTQIEHKVFCQKYFKIDYTGKFNSLLQIAEVLAGAKGFISNPNGLYALAEQMKIPRILLSPDFLLVDKQIQLGPKNNLPLGGICSTCSSTNNLIDLTKLLLKI